MFAFSEIGIPIFVYKTSGLSWLERFAYTEDVVGSSPTLPTSIKLSGILLDIFHKFW